MVDARPFVDAAAMMAAGDAIWTALTPADRLEAFAAHPRIGETGAGWSAQEQAGVGDSADATRRRLADANREYEARFGYIFIICATGRTAGEMLDALERRLANDPGVEAGVAAEEQRKIIRLRLAKLIGTEQVTTS